jgi:hypothetical protein
MPASPPFLRGLYGTIKHGLFPFFLSNEDKNADRWLVRRNGLSSKELLTSE